MGDDYGGDGGYDGSGGAYSYTNDTFGNGNSGYETGGSSFGGGWNSGESLDNHTGIATDKAPSTNLERSSSCDKDEGISAEREQASLGEIRRESTDSAIDDVMNTASENNNDEDERDRSVEEENLSRREEDEQQRPYSDLNEHSMSSDLLECLFCCVIA